LGYYNGHIHGNWDWFYRYEAVPFASDIFNYLLNNNGKFYVNIKSSLPNTQLEQLLMVLPRDSLMEIVGELDNKLLKKLKRIFNTYSEELESYYPKIVKFEIINKEYLWQSKIFLKPLLQNHSNESPPSTDRTAPVTYSDLINPRQASAISSAVPVRRSGAFSCTCLWRSAHFSPLVQGVSMKPGAMARPCR
jgi:hypothetical protein